MTSQRKRTYWKLGIWFSVIALVVVCYVVSDSLFPLFVALGLAYACNPLADVLERRGVSRTLTACALLTVIVGLLALFIGLLIPAVVHQAQDFFHDLPDLASKAMERATALANRFNITLPANPNEVIDRLRDVSQDASAQTLTPVVTAARHLVTRAAGFLITFLDLLIIPIFFFYSLRDFHRAKRYVVGLIPPRRRAQARVLFHRFDRVLSGYIHGQLLVACLLAVAYGVGLPILGVRFGLFIGILAGFLNVVPYLGQFTGISLSLLMALVDFSGGGQLVGICVLFGTVGFIESHFVTPKVVGGKVGLSPLWSIIALIVGGRLAGILGMIVAVPVAGCLKVVLEEVLAGYRGSDYFNEPPASMPVIKG